MIALHIICLQYSHDNLSDLIDGGVDVTAKALEAGVTPLHSLCITKVHCKNLISFVRLLIRKDIDVTTKSSTGLPVLEFLRIIWDHEIDPTLAELLGGNLGSNTCNYAKDFLAQ